MDTLTGQSKKPLPPPLAFRKVRVDRNAINGLADVHVEFDNVVGGLVSPSRPEGFAFVQGGKAQPVIFDSFLAGDTVVLRTSRLASEVNTLELHYGLGSYPVCSITDKADRAVPVFGPIALGVPRAITPFVRSMRATEFLDGAGNLNSLPKTLGEALDSVAWRRVDVNQDFFSIRQEIVAHGNADKLIYFRFSLEVPEPMKLRTHLGYDGPVKLWLDGRQIFHDASGMNPAIQDAKSIDGKFAAGVHELTFALGTNAGRAWGVFVRFERSDVSARLLKKGIGAYLLPKF